ncbi:MAG: hypothetical protein IPO21_05080 [Bacteroidales bacterium]|nr:hypothetical protein [Bacteroidales bacterium]
MRLFFVIILVLFANFIYGQYLKFDHLSSEQNINDKYIECLFEDSYGFIWIGTNSGLFQYDGYTAKKYQSIEHDTTSLINNNIATIAEDSDKNIWIGHRFNGISILNRKTGSFTRVIIPDENDSVKLTKNGFRKIVFDADNNLWAMTAYGIGKLMPNTNKWKWYDQTSDSVFFKNQYAFAFTQTDEKEIWISVLSSGMLLKYNKTKDLFDNYIPNQTDSRLSFKSGITCLESDYKQNIWIGTLRDSLFKLTPKTGEIVSYKKDKEKSIPFSNNEIFSLVQDSKKNIWIGTINDGLYKYDYTTENFTQYKIDPKDKYSISSNSISCIIETKEGDLFFGTHSGGVNLLNFRKNKFNYIGKNDNKNIGLAHQQVSAIYKETPSLLWVGTDGGGLHLIDHKEGTTKIFSYPQHIPSNVVLDIEPNGDGKLWLATWTGGICLFDPKTEKSTVFKPISGKKGWINNSNVKGLLKDGDFLLIACHGNGLNIYDIKKTHSIILKILHLCFHLIWQLLFGTMIL